jgi:hypothetical protein
MIKKVLILSICIFSIGWTFEGGWDPGKIPADRVSTDITNFNGNLSSADTTVQKSLDTLDNVSVTGLSGWTRTGTNVLLTTSTDNVGIGTSVPRQKLDVIGSALFSGNVGIGTSIPTGKLEIVGGDVRVGTGTFNNSGASDDLYVTGNLEIDGIYYGNGSGLTSVPQLWTNVGNNLYPTTIANNVGIGTTTISNTLTVEGATGGIDINYRTLPIAADSYVKYLDHYTGADGATSHTPNIGSALNFVGTAQIDNAWGAVASPTSVLLDGNSDYVYSDTALDFSNSNFSIELWVKSNSNPGMQDIMECKTSASGYPRLDIVKYTGGQLRFLVQSAVPANIASYETTGNVITDTNSHKIEVTRSGSNLFILIDGSSVALTTTTAIGTATIPAFDSCSFGWSRTSSNFYWNGWFDENRISIGTARNVSNYLVETVEFDPKDSVIDSPSITLQTSGTDRWTFGGDGVNSNAFVIASSGALTSSPRFTINTSGNVGIGTTAPVDTLQVSGTFSARTASGLQGLHQNSVGNVGIGMSTEGAKLDVNGDIKLSGTDNIILNNNWVSGDGGDEGVFVLANGNVGIGSSNPGQKLDVNGTIRTVTGTGIISTLYNNTILDATGTNTALSIKNNAGTSTLMLVNYSTGNVGIGSSTGINNKLQVIGSVGIGSTAYGVSAPTNGMIVQGNVGIGTTNPKHSLEIMGKLAITQLVAPTVSSCGTSPSIIAGSTDSCGEVTVGSDVAPINSCLITFNSAFLNAPHCFIQPESEIKNFSYESTTGTLTIQSTDDLDGVTVDWLCIGF